MEKEKAGTISKCDRRMSEYKPALVICAVGARNELSVGVVAGEPALQIKFTNGGVVEGP
jgi:hypothetical protein